VSVRRPGDPLGTRCEIKNVNSIRFIGQAIEHEARRQIAVIEDGGKIEQETRLFDPVKGATRSMRNKEEAHDYRYFPDPDLLPLELTQSYIDELARELPELPDAKKARFMGAFGLSAYVADVLVAERETVAHFQEMVDRGAEPKVAANWLLNEYVGRLNKAGLTITTGPLTPSANTAIVQMISSNEISGKIAKELVEILWEQGPGADPRAIVAEHGLKQITDPAEIEKIVDEILAANPDKVAQAKEKPTALNWLVGQVMKASGGKANPQAVNALLKNRIGL